LITVGINVRKKKKPCPTFCYLIPGGKILKASNQIDIFLPISQGHNKDDIARHYNMDVPSFPSFKDLIPRLLGGIRPSSRPGPD